MFKVKDAVGYKYRKVKVVRVRLVLLVSALSHSFP